MRKGRNRVCKGECWGERQEENGRESNPMERERLQATVAGAGWELKNSKIFNRGAAAAL